MQMPMTAEDIVVGIFNYLKSDNVSRVTSDREKLHRAFFRIKEKNPEKMSVFTFREREQFPESMQLDQALSNLDAAGLISRQNLTPRYYCFEEPLINSYVSFSKKILEDDGISEKMIESFAKEIKSMLCENYNDSK